MKQNSETLETRERKKDNTHSSLTHFQLFNRPMQMADAKGRRSSTFFFSSILAQLRSL